MYWVNTRLAQRKGLTFHQTRSNAIILHDTLHHCLERVVSTKDNWQKDWKHDAAASSTNTKPIQINQKDQLARTVKPVTFRDRVRLDQESTTKHVESDSDLISTVQPVARDEELITHKIDFRIQGLPHSSVEEPEHLRVRELINRIENHAHRDELQEDLTQDDIYNPFTTW